MFVACLLCLLTLKTRRTACGLSLCSHLDVKLLAWVQHEWTAHLHFCYHYFFAVFGDLPFIHYWALEVIGQSASISLVELELGTNQETMGTIRMASIGHSPVKLYGPGGPRKKCHAHHGSFQVSWFCNRSSCLTDSHNTTLFVSTMIIVRLCVRTYIYVTK